MSGFDYQDVSFPDFDEALFEQAVIDHLQDDLGYIHLFGPDVERSDESYRDVFLPGILPDALQRINPSLPRQAIDEAIIKLSNIEAGSLEQKNEAFSDYLQSGVEVRFVEDGEEKNDLVRVLDLDDPEKNHLAYHWVVVLRCCSREEGVERATPFALCAMSPRVWSGQLGRVCSNIPAVHHSKGPRNAKQAMGSVGYAMA